MISAGLSIREDGGHLMVTLRGELDVVDAASVAAALAPRRQVRRIGALTGLAGVFSVRTSLAAAAPAAGRSGPDPGWTCIGTGSHVKAVRALR